MLSIRKNLLVEGDEDLRAIVRLVSKHTPWPENKDNLPVKFEACGGATKILEKNFIPTKLQSREVETLGIVIDADDNFSGKWQCLRSLCRTAFPTMPDDLPHSGLCIDNDDGKRLGVWIMPDNKSRGMLETFMACLLPNGQDQVWSHAQQSLSKARDLGANCRDVHLDKANIYTWLAWQDPPGQSLGSAILKCTLDHRAESAMQFTRWFKTLYGLPDLPIVETLSSVAVA